MTIPLAMLRRLVDLTWNHATESEQCPSTKMADRLIKEAGFTLVGEWDTRPEASDVSKSRPDDKPDDLADHVAQAILASAKGINDPKIQDDLSIPYRLSSSRTYARRYAEAAIAAVDEWRNQ